MVVNSSISRSAGGAPGVHEHDLGDRSVPVETAKHAWHAWASAIRCRPGGPEAPTGRDGLRRCLAPIWIAGGVNRRFSVGATPTPALCGYLVMLLRWSNTCDSSSYRSRPQALFCPARAKMNNIGTGPMTACGRPTGWLWVAFVVFITRSISPSVSCWLHGAARHTHAHAPRAQKQGLVLRVLDALSMPYLALPTARMEAPLGLQHERLQRLSQVDAAQALPSA